MEPAEIGEGGGHVGLDRKKFARIFSEHPPTKLNSSLEEGEGHVLLASLRESARLASHRNDAVRVVRWQNALVDREHAVVLLQGGWEVAHGTKKIP